MNSFPSNAKFKYSWRSYQKKVLDEFDNFLHDRHLHIVAPPGSGKTVLGLEAAIRLNKPTLILAPTLTIRDQWIDRLCELFLETNIVPDWISTDIRKPQFLTLATYQGLHMACSDGNLTKIVTELKKFNIETLVLDEAHHLKNQWWITLDNVKSALSPIIVGLTATPPYDSSYTEWQRYLNINGPIDKEISIPDLIKTGDLCPHQDYVYFSQPTVEEKQRIYKYRDNILSVFQEYSRSEVLIESFMKSDIWINPENNLEWIYDNSVIYTSYLILLNFNGIEIPESHFNVLGIENEDKKNGIPDLVYERLEIILNFFLYQDSFFFTQYEEDKERIINKLQHKGAIEKKAVNLSFNTNLNRLLVASNSKLNSIINIAQFEYKSLQGDLRMVILTDFIRNEYLAFNETELQDLKKIGVIPIFEQLLANNIGTERCGVLTGSIVILPKSSITRFQELCNEKGLKDISCFTQDYRDKHILIENSTAIKDSIVQLTTQLFTEGEIKILVGTKALLGEGWDAPAINSLILASFIGSFVLSNQMRGRAIRVQRNNPTKTSNIWHLVCTDPTDPKGGQDLDVLKRRFKSFIGVSNGEDLYIENGLNRLNVQRDIYSPEIINELNKETLTFAHNRDQLARRWDDAIEKGNFLIDEIKLPTELQQESNYNETKRMYFTRTIAYLIGEVLIFLTIFGYEMLSSLLKNLRMIRSGKDAIIVLSIAILVGAIVMGREALKGFKLYVRYRDISKDINNIATTLCLSLIKQGAIKTPESEVSAQVETDKTGAVSCFLKGGTSGEQSVFLDALGEILNPIANPRYIIIRKSKKHKLKKNDYHSVPNLLGVNKTLAYYFANTWRTLVGKNELIYTRTLQGRRLLLKARINSLSAKLSDDLPERYRKWE